MEIPLDLRFMAWLKRFRRDAVNSRVVGSENDAFAAEGIDRRIKLQAVPR